MGRPYRRQHHVDRQPRRGRRQEQRAAGCVGGVERAIRRRVRLGEPPVLNLYTRIATEMCAAHGILRVTGYESVPGFDLPQAVTQPREVVAPADDVTSVSPN